MPTANTLSMDRQRTVVEAVATAADASTGAGHYGTCHRWPTSATSNKPGNASSSASKAAAGHVRKGCCTAGMQCPSPATVQRRHRCRKARVAQCPAPVPVQRWCGCTSSTRHHMQPACTCLGMRRCCCVALACSCNCIRQRSHPASSLAWLQSASKASGLSHPLVLVFSYQPKMQASSLLCA